MIIKIWKFFWNLLGDIRLTLYLLLSAVLLFITGSFYVKFNFPLFNGLNETRFQDWVIKNFADNIGIAWWMPLLIIVLSLLGINTFICSFDRMRALLPKKKDEPVSRFMYKLAPSIIHYLFLVIILGHCITFTMGSWTRFPLAENAVIEYGDIKLNVLEINREYFPGNIRMGDRISQINVLMKDDAGKTLDVSYRSRAEYKGYDLQLDMEKKPVPQPQQILPENKKENCDKAPVFQILKPENLDERNLQLLIISDPGLYVIIAGFTLILIVMTLYYIMQGVKKFN